MFPHNSVSPLLPSKRKAPSEEQQQQQQQQQQFSVSLPVAPLETHHLYRQLFSQQQQQQQVLQHRSDLQIVQSLLEGCPLRVSAAELVNEKLGARALRLDDSRRQQRQRQQQQQQQQQKQKQQQLKLSRTQAKRLGLFDVAAEFGCCSSRNRRRQQQQQQQQQGLGLQDLLPLFDLWQQYALSVCGIESSAAAAAASGSSSSSNSNSSGKSRKQKGGLPGGPQGVPQGPPKLCAYSRCSAAAHMDLHGSWVYVHRSRCPSLCGLAGLVVLDTQQCLLLLCADGYLRRVPKSCCVFLLLLADGSSFFLHGQQQQLNPAARSKQKLKPKQTIIL